MNRPLPQWTEPGVYEVLPGIHRIPLPLPDDGLRAVNVYAVADGDRVVPIDSGWALAESQNRLARALDAIGYGLEHVSEFLVTHLHRDHYTQALAVRRTYGSPVSLGAGERPALEWLIREVPTRPVSQLDQLARSGADDVLARLATLPEDTTVDDKTWELPDRWFKGSVEIRLATRTLRAIPTPGHTQGHLVFLDAEAGALFAGDHVLPHITPSIGFETVPGRSPLGDYLASLLLVRTMPDVRLLPAHGPVTDSVHRRVDELLDHHAARLDATLTAVADGAHTAREVAGRLGWTRRQRPFEGLDPFNQMLSVLETRAHLDVLAERGMLRATDVDGVTRYQA
ncbi:MBL fold metallo-hydrolase [Streptomyces sp. NPDC052101]|uniref:MBL fold metallo-hydrolase n=1 Tax=Streptomyces sp. NPDC052101 TaxID=3155763 RepID=UPI0034404700